MTSDLKSETLITLVSMCILSLTAILVASEAMATSEVNSVTLITYVSLASMSVYLIKFPGKRRLPIMIHYHGFPENPD